MLIAKAAYGSKMKLIFFLLGSAAGVNGTGGATFTRELVGPFISLVFVLPKPNKPIMQRTETHRAITKQIFSGKIELRFSEFQITAKSNTNITKMIVPLFVITFDIINVLLPLWIYLN